MTENDYLLAWALYAVAGLGCLLVWFRMTGWIWRWLREPLRVLMAVLLLTPTIVEPGRDLYAPALAITALDLLFKVGNNAWKAVSDLAVYASIGMALYLLYALIRWPIERWWAGRQRQAEVRQAADSEPTLRELMRQEGRADVETREDAHGDRRLRIEPRL